MRGCPDPFADHAATGPPRGINRNRCDYWTSRHFGGLEGIIPGLSKVLPCSGGHRAWVASALRRSRLACLLRSWHVRSPAARTGGRHGIQTLSAYVCDVVLCMTPFDVSEMVFFCEECAEEVPDPVLVSVIMMRRMGPPRKRTTPTSRICWLGGCCLRTGL